MQVLFRAKEKNSNNYVIGYEYYNHIEDEYYITHYVSGSNYKIDRTTRSINIEDMLDSKGKKIFASLGEDGKGGDILLEESRLMCTLKIDESAFREFTAIHTMNGNRFTNEKILSDIGSYRYKYFKGYDIMIYDFFMMKKRNIKIIGIQQ